MKSNGITYQNTIDVQLANDNAKVVLLLMQKALYMHNCTPIKITIENHRIKITSNNNKFFFNYFFVCLFILFLAFVSFLSLLLYDYYYCIPLYVFGCMVFVFVNAILRTIKTSLFGFFCMHFVV